MPELKKMPMWAVLVAVGLVALVSLAIGLGPMIWRGVRDRNIVREGVEAQARIVEMTDTGNRFNHNPQVRLVVEVHPAKDEPFRAELTVVVSPVALQSWGEGTMIPVKYDPGDSSRVALVTR